MAKRFSEDERQLILKLERWFLDPGITPGICHDDLIDALPGISDARLEAAMRRVESMGGIENAGLMGTGKLFSLFFLKPEIRDMANDVRADDEREIAEKAVNQQPPDLVDGIVKKARSHPRLAWGMVIVLALAVGLTIVNGLFDLAKNILDFFFAAPNS